jgi:hypothetical protein
MAGATLLPRMHFSISPLAPIHKFTLREPALRSCYYFIARTLFRSNAHLQVVSAFAAVGLVTTAEALTSIRADQFFWVHHSPSADFLSIPFILSYCFIVGTRSAFEIPAILDANWVFRLWLPRDDRHARSVARRVLLTFSLSWIVPSCFGATWIYFGWRNALLHTTILIASNALLAEVLLVRFRKIPFTCSYPAFQSNSGLILVAYLFGFFVFTDYLPELEHWALASSLRALCLVPLFATAFAALHAYRSQILDMDKQLLFEESSPSAF